MRRVVVMGTMSGKTNAQTIAYMRLSLHELCPIVLQAPIQYIPQTMTYYMETKCY
jgi:hypothetical protein